MTQNSEQLTTQGRGQRIGRVLTCGTGLAELERLVTCQAQIRQSRPPNGRGQAARGGDARCRANAALRLRRDISQAGPLPSQDTAWEPGVRWQTSASATSRSGCGSRTPRRTSVFMSGRGRVSGQLLARWRRNCRGERTFGSTWPTSALCPPRPALAPSFAGGGHAPDAPRIAL